MEPGDLALLKYKPELTGKEIEMGFALIDLAKYANKEETSEKLAINDRKDMFIEIIVTSKPIDISG